MNSEWVKVIKLLAQFQNRAITEKNEPEVSKIDGHIRAMQKASWEKTWNSLESQ